MTNISKLWKAAATGVCALALAFTTRAQVNTNPVPNLAISWIIDVWGFSGTSGGNGLPVPLPAGLALATNWNDGWQENYSDISGVPPVAVNNLFDITGATTGMGIIYAAWGGAAANGGGPLPQDANGTYNKQMLNGYLNAGPAAWLPNITNSYVIITNVPYTNYDVIVYIDSDTSGRRFRLTDGPVSYYGSTLGGVAEVENANALFLPANQTNSGQFPGADFAFFPGLTTSTNSFACYPLSGNDQWLGIAGFQVIQASNVYVLYGAAPATQIVPRGQSASFSVMAGGLNPTYQWRHAGTNILNATNATYTIASTVTGQDGNYDVVVTNNFSSSTSLVASLTFYAPKTLEWAGVGSTWDTSSLDWTLNGGISATNYTDTDNVRFDPLGVAQSSVSLGGTLSPTSITVSNAGYMLATGDLAGGGSLHLTRNATLILDTIDNRTGPTLIDNGSTLQVDNGDAAGSLGSGALTNNGALLFDSTSASLAYGYPVYGTGNITNLGPSGTLTLGNNVNANYLVQAGGGVLLLQGNNSLSGGLVVSGGTIWARVSGALGQGNVILDGGQLQLIFANDFTGSAMTLAGGTLYGGQIGNNSYDGIVSLAVDSDIEVGANDTFTLNNTAGLNGAGFNLSVNGLGGSGTLILPGGNNTWGSLTIFGGTLQIGIGGTATLGAGTISGGGNLTFDLVGNLTVTNPIALTGSINQDGVGILNLAGDLTGYFGTTTVSAGELDGTNTFNGGVSIAAGGTLAVGNAATIGTITINGGLTLGGNVLVKLNKSLFQSNDVVAVPGGVNNTNNGIVTVENLGPALAVGDKFTLFSQAVSGGDTMSVLGGGVIWNNNLAVDGSIAVLATSVPHPIITSTVVSPSTLVFGGNNGYPGSAYAVLATTNLTSSWSVVATGNFSGTGTFSVTNPITPGVPQTFYRLEQ